MQTRISNERLEFYRGSLGQVSTNTLRAILDGTQTHNLSAETLDAIRLLLVERQGGGRGEAHPANSAPGGLPIPACSPSGHCSPANGASGRKRIIVVIAMFFVICAGLLALAATGDEVAWLRVTNDENIADEQAYLVTWPAGRHAAEARARTDHHAWIAATQFDSVDGYEQYLSVVPNGVHVADAKNRIEILKWETALGSRSIRRLREFLRDYPDSQYASEANLQVDALSRQEAEAAIQRIRQLRSQLADIYIFEGARGDGSGRDWQNACPDLGVVLEDALTPGAKIHLAAGVITNSVAVPDNIVLVCGYGRSAQGGMELDSRSHRVWFMPSAHGTRSLSLGKGGRISGLWLGLGTRAALGPGTWSSMNEGSDLKAQQTGSLREGSNGYTFCESIDGPARLELTATQMQLVLHDACRLEDYDPLSRRVISTTRGTGIYVQRPGDLPLNPNRAPF